MTRSIHAAELTLVPSPDARSAPAADAAPEPSNPAPRRMTKRCRRCGKTVPTLAGLVWRAKQLAAHVDSVGSDVLRARVETDATVRADALRRAHQTQQNGRDEAQKLHSDLKRLQAHDRRCHPHAQPVGESPHG